MSRITLLEMLVKARMITQQQFDESLQNRVLHGGKIGTSLIELGFVKEEALAQFLSRKLAVPYVRPELLLTIQPEVIALLAPELARKYRAIPIRLKGKRLFVVMEDPADLKAIDDMAFATGLIIQPLVTPEVRLVEALGKYYGAEVSRRYQRIIQRIEEERLQEAGTVPPPAAAPKKPAQRQKMTPPPETREEPLEELEDVIQPETSGQGGEKEAVAEDWKERVRHYSIDEISRTLSRADDREEIGRAVLAFLGGEFRRAGLFLLRGGEAIGWMAVADGGELQDFPAFHIPMAEPSVLKSVAENASPHLGPIPENPANLQTVTALGATLPASGLFMPLQVLGRVVLVLYAEDAADLEGRIPVLERLLAKMALAFEILICREKILML